MRGSREQPWLSARTVAMLMLVSFVAVLISLTVSSDRYWDSFLVATIVTSCFTLGLVLILLAGKILPKLPVGFSILLASLAVLGAVRGWIFFTVTELFEFQNPVELGVRMLNSTLSVVLWGAIFVAIDSKLAQFHRSYRDLVANRTATVFEAVDGRTIGIADLIDQSSELVDFQNSLRAIAKRAGDRELSQSELHTAASQIRHEMEVSLRPLSKRIWLKANDTEPKFHWLEVFRESLRQLPFSFWRVSAAASVAYLIGLLSLVPQPQALVQSAGYALALHFALYLTQRFGRARSWQLGLVLVLLSAIAGSLGAIVAGELTLGTQMAPTSLPQYFLGPISSFGFIIAATIWAQLRSDWERINQLVAEDSPNANLLSLRLAGFLHNSVQSRINSLALALERIHPDDQAGLQEIIRELEAIASKSIGAEFASTISDPVGKLNRLTDAWGGIIEVSYSLDDSAQTNPNLGLVVEVVEEAISNAVRHSGAKQIFIDVEDSARGLLVRIAHSATSAERGKKSVGTQWLERFSLDYRIRRLPSGDRELSVII